MKKARSIIMIIGIFILPLSGRNLSGIDNPQAGSGSQQTTTKAQDPVAKAKQTTSKTQQTVKKTQQPVKKTPQTTAKPKTGTKTQQAATKPAQNKNATPAGTVRIGQQIWSVTNLNVNTFRNGDTIPEAKTNMEWYNAGQTKKPAWCYYNNDPANGQKYGKLYNWYAVNDPRGLAPVGWILPNNNDWGMLTRYLGGQELAGTKIKSIKGWEEGYNGTNESGFNALPGGYRVENGAFMNLGSNSIWWSTDESNSQNAIDHYLGIRGSLNTSSSPKQRGSSVRCLKE